MKYFKLKNLLNTKYVGNYPQIQLHKNKGNLEEYEKDKISIENILPPIFILDNASIITSSLSCVFVNRNSFFIVNNKLLTFIKESFKHNHIQDWEIIITQNNNSIDDYYLIHIKDTLEKEIVDFKKTDFLKKKLGNSQQKFLPKPIEINSLEDYKVSSENGYIIISNNLRLDFSKTKDDLLRIDNTPPFSFANGYYVSERLKDAILSKGFTGLAFQELSTLKKVKLKF